MVNLAAQLLFAVQAIKQHGVPSYLLNSCTYVLHKQVYFNREALKSISHNGWSSGIFYPEHHKSFFKQTELPRIFFILNVCETVFPNANEGSYF